MSPPDEIEVWREQPSAPAEELWDAPRLSVQPVTHRRNLWVILMLNFCCQVL